MRKLLSLCLLAGLLAAPAARAQKSAAVTDNLKDLFVELSKRLVPSVVNIYTTQAVMAPQWNPQAEMYRRFFEQFFGEEIMPEPPQGQGHRPSSLGSGFVFDEKEGLILTNYHVIADAEEIKVVLSEDDADKDGIDAKVIGGDSEADVAVLQVKTKKKLQAAPLGDSDDLEVGDWVMAVGNPFGHGHTVTKGIISAKERIIPLSQFSNFIQTDAPINPGNSGGPLINTAGHVVGINSAINQAAQGIGFAIPINYVKKLLPELRTKGMVTRGFIGVNITEITPPLARQLGIKRGVSGVLVSEVFEDGPAASAGIRPYDVIQEVGGKRVQNGRQLIAAISAVAPGNTVDLRVLRAGKEVTVGVKVGSRPTREAMASRGQGGSGAPRMDRRVVASIGMRVGPLDDQIRREWDLPKNVKGVVVTQVIPGGAAEEAGVAPGDVIVEVDQKPVATVESFYARFRTKKSYLLRFRRGDSFVIATLDLSGKKPAPDDE
ncbi:MAG: Do family serine endopeptidase [Bdellovibrionales bacterium]|nr:Do family serine endopeptidase [Bdellovibrionales bacterium]